jgi:hypothetical protein
VVRLADRRTGQREDPGQDRKGLEETGQGQGMVQGEVAADAGAGGPRRQAQPLERLRHTEISQLLEPTRVDRGGFVAHVFGGDRGQQQRLDAGIQSAAAVLDDVGRRPTALPGRAEQTGEERLHATVHLRLVALVVRAQAGQMFVGAIVAHRHHGSRDR